MIRQLVQESSLGMRNQYLSLTTVPDGYTHFAR